MVWAGLSGELKTLLMSYFRVFFLYATSPAYLKSVQDHYITSVLPMLTFCDGGQMSSGVFHVGLQLTIFPPSLTGVNYRQASGLIPT